jgi:hypothetical protein
MSRNRSFFEVTTDEHGFQLKKELAALIACERWLIRRKTLICPMQSCFISMRFRLEKTNSLKKFFVYHPHTLHWQLDAKP